MYQKHPYNEIFYKDYYKLIKIKQHHHYDWTCIVLYSVTVN